MIREKHLKFKKTFSKRPNIFKLCWKDGTKNHASCTDYEIFSNIAVYSKNEHVNVFLMNEFFFIYLKY